MFINNKYVCAGFTAALAGYAESSCDLLFDAPPRKLWMAGYELAKLLEVAPPEDNELERVDKDPMQQGADAWRKAIALSDNPYGFGDPNGNEEEKTTNASHTAWDRGWRAAFDEAKDNFSEEYEKPMLSGHVSDYIDQPPGVYNLEQLDKASGGNVSYYLVPVPYPKRGGPAYTFEVEDVIEFAQMTFDEGCEFKAIVRTAMARLGTKKPGQDAVYDAEKRVHYATRSLVTEKRKAVLSLPERFPV